ncbi:MAG: ATP-binding protein [Methanohalophilus sp.]
MVRGSVGVIFGETGTLNFKFLISDSTAVLRGHYVKIWHETDGWILAQVMSIVRSSEKYSLEEAKKGQRKDRNDDRIVASATIIGSRDDRGLLRAPMSPFSPGDLVYLADDTLIRDTLGLVGDDMYIGLLEGTGIPVHLNVNSLVQKHCSILAKTGSGKSYTAGVILEELLDHNVPMLIIDPHSEYSSLKESASGNEGDMKKYGIKSKGYGSRVQVYTPADKSINPNADHLFRLNGVNLTPSELMTLFPDNFNSTHSGILYEAVHRLRADVETYFLDDIIREVSNNESKARWNVINLLEDINQLDILSPQPTPVEELMQDGKASIIDLKGVPPHIQTMIVAQLCDTLFEARKLGTIPPGMLVVEEAHNFAPERGYSKSSSSEILRTIASEGRKFGLGMLVISQRPARVDKNVLSQCGSQIILKVTNPNDLKSISKGLEGVNSYVEEELLRLPPGIAMLVSNDIERPILVDIRVRKSKHGGESVKILNKSPSKASLGAKKESKTEPATKPVDENKSQSPPPKRKPSRNPKKDSGSLFNKLFGSESK